MKLQCQNCNKFFDTERSNSMYCGLPCRKKAYYQRKKVRFELRRKESILGNTPVPVKKKKSIDSKLSNVIKLGTFIITDDMFKRCAICGHEYIPSKTNPKETRCPPCRDFNSHPTILYKLRGKKV